MAEGPRPTATVVIPCRDHANELARCLESLRRQIADFSYETIVVDSADDARVAAVARDGGATVERGGATLLPGPARNLGAARARGEYLAFIDADCQADPRWLASAIRGLDRGATIVGGPVLNARPWHLVASCDNLLQFADFPGGRKDGPARYFPGCNMALRRADFLVVGGFPDVAATSGEDTTFCNRLLERWPDGLAFVQEMRVRHEGRSGLLQFLGHQKSFGRARGLLGLHLSETHLRWGRTPLAIPAVVLKRFLYIGKRVVAWDPLAAFRLVLLSPLILAGLTAWADGFVRGCRARVGQGARDADSPPISETEERAVRGKPT